MWVFLELTGADCCQSWGIRRKVRVAESGECTELRLAVEFYRMPLAIILVLQLEWFTEMVL